jgi:hypothetical protein
MSYFARALILVAVAFTPTLAQARGGGGGGHSSAGYSGGLSGTGSSSSSHSVSGYVNSHGTYVAPSHATNPNGTQRDNYTARGNVNPYTGVVGTRSATH